MGFFWTIVALVVVLGLAWRYLGSYMEAVFDGRVHWLGFVERPIYWMLGTSPEQEQSWKRYAGVARRVLRRLDRHHVPAAAHPGEPAAQPPALRRRRRRRSRSTPLRPSSPTRTGRTTAARTTMSYFSQMAALTVQQFVSPAVGIAAAIAMVRGFSRRGSATIGNFWVDVTRCLLYILLPIAFVFGLVFVGQGAVDTLAGTASFHDVLNGVSQTIARGPIGFMEAIKQLGTNGGGFLDANSATTFENPTGLTNFLSIVLLLCIPFALTYTFGKMVGSVRHGVALLGAMVIIFGSWVAFTSYAEHQSNPAVAQAGVRADCREHRGQGGPLRRHDDGAVRRRLDQHLDRFGRRLLRPVHPDRRDGPAHRHDARRGHTRRHGQRAVHDPHLRDHRRVHRRADDRANTGVPGQEDPGEGDQARRPRLPRDADHRAGLHCCRGVDPRRTRRPAQRRPARLHRDPLRPHLAGEQQRLGLRRAHRQHHLLQRDRWGRHAARPLRDHDPRPRTRRRARRQAAWCPPRSGRSAPTTACSSGS